MLLQVAIFVLNLHILKRASQLPLRERLNYLKLCRITHLFCIPVFAILTIGCCFCALAVFFPQLLTMLRIPLPSDQGQSPFLMSGSFLFFASFCGLFCSVLFVTREILASYWLLNFLLYYDISPNCLIQRWNPQSFNN